MKTATRILAFAAALFACVQLFAQTATRGIVVGRVFNADTGQYLNLARVTVAGTTLETFTNESGDFVLANVPAGTAKIQASYTGLALETITLNIPADGGRVTADFSLSATARAAGDKALVLDAFTVAANREMAASAIAINEQRNSAAQKTVVAAEDFGAFPDGNMGEFLKFLPGVNIDYLPEPRGISLRGMAGNFTSVTVDGMAQASAATGSATRAFELEQISINSLSRAEVVKSRTPDLPANALGGSINLVSRSAFDVNKPIINYSVFLNANSRQMTTSETPAAYGGRSHKLKPSGSLNVTYPLSKTLGFAVSYLNNQSYRPYDSGRPFYAPYSQSTPSIATVANPIVARWDLQDVVTEIENSSTAGSVDWKFSTYDKITISGSYDTFLRNADSQYFVFNIGNGLPRSYGQTFTRGALGSGSVQLGGNGTSNADKAGNTANVAATYEHRGPVWLITAGTKFSRSKNFYEAGKHGRWNNVLLSLRGGPTNGTFVNPTVSFLDMDQGGYLSPGRIEIHNSTGTALIDPMDLNNYNITSVDDNQRRATDYIKTAKVDVSRWVPMRMPTKVKMGVMVQDQIRDISQNRPGTLTFVGPDGAPNTADDNAGLYPIAQTEIRARPYYGPFPFLNYVDSHKVWDLYVAHPEYFRLNNVATGYINNATSSRYFNETIYSAYAMLDLKPVERLRVVTGLRMERTKLYGEGTLQDSTAHFRRDANGNLERDANNRPIPTTTDQLRVAMLQYKARGRKGKKSYDGYYPSLDATYSVTPEFQVRASATRSIGRPNLDLIIPGVTIGETSINVVNTELKPMQTNSFDVGLEYYFKTVGLFTITGFRKDMKNPTASFSQPATLELLNQYDIPDPDQYVNGYTFTTRLNGGSARITGVEVSYRRSLEFSFLPRWTKDVSFFANGSSMHLIDNGYGEFGGYISRQGSAGLSYIGRRFSGNVKTNYRGLQRLSRQGFAPGAYDYNLPRLFIDADIEFRLVKYARLFVSARNITDSPIDNARYVDGQPYYNRVRKQEKVGATYVFGVKGTF